MRVRTCGECAVKRHHYAGAAAVVGDDGAVVHAVARVETYVAVAEIVLPFRQVAVIELVAVIIAGHVHALDETVAQAGVQARGVAYHNHSRAIPSWILNTGHSSHHNNGFQNRTGNGEYFCRGICLCIHQVIFPIEFPYKI